MRAALLVVLAGAPWVAGLQSAAPKSRRRVLPAVSQSDASRRAGDASRRGDAPALAQDFVAEAGLKYDPLAAEELLWRQPARWLQRNVELFVPLSFFVASVMLDTATGYEDQRRKQRAGELLAILSGLGPAIIKAGQALASRPDLLPAEYLQELQKLQDRVPAFDTAVALKRVEDSLGLKDGFEATFELVEREAIAAASIGQVYKARLRNVPGSPLVALKVQRPACEEIIALDLFILRWYAKLFSDFLQKAFKRDLDFVSVIDDFGRLIYQEIDYRAEAANAVKFAEMFGHGHVNTAATKEGRPRILVPKVYSQLSTDTVLTMEWVDGSRLVDGAALVHLTGDEEAPAKLVYALVQCSLRQMLDSGFFHADPHAGNLLATQGGDLVYLDFGMMSYLETSQRAAIIEAVVHLVNRDFDALADLYKRMGFIKQDVDVTPIVSGLAAALPDVLDASVADLNIKNIFGKLGAVMYTFPFALPPFYIAIIRCLGVLEGVAMQVDPLFRIVSDAYPFIAARLLTGDAPELQLALRNLLFKDDRPQWGRLEALVDRATAAQDYDATKAILLFVDLVSADDAEALRDNLVDDVVAGLDAVGVETARELLKAVGLDLPEHMSQTAQKGKRRTGSTEDEERPPVVRVLLRARDALRAQTNDLSRNPELVLGAANEFAQRYAPLAQRLLEHATVRRVAAEVAAQLTERFASRAIRLGFFRFV
ncbi:ABC1 family-domain-containing protein [Pelagophyceae sp. CCMP2097]|nr:ABC1 family-domain-containing protein [Pelagophyceae sp. CCMP2097]